MLCERPFAVAVTVKVYVPGGVDGPPPTVPLEPPPAAAQLASPRAPMQSTRSKSHEWERLCRTNGQQRQAKAIVNPVGHNGNLFNDPGMLVEAACASPVLTKTTKLPVVLAGTDSLVGLKVQELLDGNAPQEKVKVPEEPLSGVSCKLN